MSTERARTFSCYRAKPKCNFAVCPLYDRSTMLGRLLQPVWVFFLKKKKKRKRNIVWVWDNGRSRINCWMAINAQCVTRVGTVFWGKIPWSTSSWIFHLWPVTQAFHTTIAIREFWFGPMARNGTCTVITARSVDIVAWPVQRRFAFCTSWKVSEVIGYSTKLKIYFQYIRRENWWKSISS